MEKLTSLVNHFNELWPESEVAEWDRSGLMIGELTAEITDGSSKRRRNNGRLGACQAARR